MITFVVGVRHVKVLSLRQHLPGICTGVFLGISPSCEPEGIFHKIQRRAPKCFYNAQRIR